MSQAQTTNSYLRDHALTRGFMLGRPARAIPTPDSKSVLFLRSEPRSPKLSLYEFDIATKQTRLLLSPESLLGGAEENLSPEEKARRERARISVGGFTTYELSKDGSLILLTLSGKLYIYDRPAAKSRELKTKPGAILDPRFSPDAKFVSFVRNYDLHTIELATDRERQITKGGTERISHGLAEFVAQEEMGRFQGYWWSPDSKQIVFQQSDATEVETWYVADPIKPEQPPHTSFYPRPGKKNVKVRLALISAKGGKPKWIQWPAQYEYLAKVTWEKNSPLCLTLQPRHQSELALFTVDLKTGGTKTLLFQRDNAWVNIDQSVPKWMPDGSFLWTNERLELRAPNGDLKQIIADKGFRSLVATAGPQVIFQASENPTELHLYSWPAPRSDEPATARKLTHEPGLYGASYNTNLLSVRSKTSADQMPVSIVCDPNGERIAELPSVAEEPPFKPNTQIVEAAGMFAEITRPKNFQPNTKLPVIVYVYGGPHHIEVTANMGRRLLRQWLADQGFIVVSIDNRGTPGRGRDWERAIYRQFGSVPLDDQVKGLHALGQEFPEMDLNRVGITGWSFGGYMSALAVLRRPDVYKAAAAGAPVIDWLDYDSHYTERYLGEINREAYLEASLLTYAKELKSPLLLMHGTADDNVYFRHTLKLVDALFKNGQPFEVLPLSGLTHMVPDPVVFERQWTRIADFFKKNL